MLLQEPVQAAIWDCLQHYGYRDALFLADRLYAEVKSEETLYLLATCYYRSGKARQTYALLKKRGQNSPDNKFLFAKCCINIGEYAEAELVLAGNILTRQLTMEDIEKLYGTLASHVFNILGAIYSRTERTQKAIECYKRSLKLNPLLWSSFEGLCHLGEKVDVTTVFPVPTTACTNVILQNTRDAHTAQNTPPIIVSEILNTIPESPITTAPTPPVNSTTSGGNLDSLMLAPVVPQEGVGHVAGLGEALTQVTPQPFQVPVPPQSLCTPHNEPVMKLLQTPETGLLDFTDHTPENCKGNVYEQVRDSISKAPTSHKHRHMASALLGPTSAASLFQELRGDHSPSFGILPMGTPPAEVKSTMFITPSPVTMQETINESKAPRKPVTRRTNPSKTLMPKPPTFNSTGNTQENNTLNAQNNPPNVRRSSRLFSHSNSSSVKENNKQQGKTRFTSPKGIGRKSKSRLNKTKTEIGENLKGDLICDNKPVTIMEPQQPQLQLAQMQQQSLAGILSLLQSVAQAYLALAQYECRRAIELFYDLPPHQMETGWVKSQIGRALFELQEFHEAEKIFKEILRSEPYHIEGMEIYSTTLWFLHKEVELSYLAQELTSIDKNSPEACCATGNCFSLQQEHETAIKFFNRAMQLNPWFAYAYTLLGHEFVYTEELDNAMACFRSAIRVSPRHYNAWFGVGLIYYKQEKFRLAEIHYRKALSINPQNSPLLCNLGMVLFSQQKSEHALATLDRAIALDPKNPLGKFHKATVLFAKQKNKEALDELEELKRIVPKESLIYFLLGKVYKKLGSTDLALMNFSWAMDLDPKGLNNHIKESIEKHFNIEEDDSLARLNVSDVPGVDVSGSNSSLMDPEDMLQAVESDESL
ncbi:cell division cycle protein 27 homolog [Mya arenaria]|uniref:cell division cycle protein 27 homolog n=1 Tax=Mya arenaria TaxID=6604 RepID=UPI0022E389A0|nr:cell division cycle protein 27 homolog [Mya arenaria]